MTHKSCKYARRSRKRHNIRMRRHDSPWPIRPLFHSSANLLSPLTRVGTVSHAYEAMMFSILTTANRHTRVCVSHGSKERRDEREAEKCQQQNGNELTQYPDWNSKTSRTQSKGCYSPVPWSAGQRKYPLVLPLPSLNQILAAFAFGISLAHSGWSQSSAKGAHLAAVVPDHSDQPVFVA